MAGCLLTINQKQDDANRQRCSGMYSRKSWGGSVDPFILTRFMKDESKDDGDPLVSIVIFEWQDEPLIGRYKNSSDSVGWQQAHEGIQLRTSRRPSSTQFATPRALQPVSAPRQSWEPSSSHPMQRKYRRMRSPRKPYISRTLLP